MYKRQYQKDEIVQVIEIQGVKLIVEKLQKAEVKETKIAGNEGNEESKDKENN